MFVHHLNAWSFFRGMIFLVNNCLQNACCSDIFYISILGNDAHINVLPSRCKIVKYGRDFYQNLHQDRFSKQKLVELLASP